MSNDEALFHDLYDRALGALAEHRGAVEAAPEPEVWNERNEVLRAALQAKLGIDVEVNGLMWEPAPGIKFHVGNRGTLYVELEPMRPEPILGKRPQRFNDVISGPVHDLIGLGELLKAREDLDAQALKAEYLARVEPAPALDQVVMTSRGEWWITQQGDRVRVQVAGEGDGAPVALELDAKWARGLAQLLNKAANRDDNANGAWREAVSTAKGYIALGFDPEWGHRLYQVAVAAPHRRAVHKMTRADAHKLARAVIAAVTGAEELIEWREAVKGAGLIPPPIRYAHAEAIDANDGELPF